MSLSLSCQVLKKIINLNPHPPFFSIGNRIHGIKSGKTLKEFRGHSSFVNDCSFSSDGSQVLSVSSDGTFKIWDIKTTSCLKTLQFNEGQEAIQGMPCPSLSSLTLHPTQPHLCLLSGRSHFVYLVDLKTHKLVKSYTPRPQSLPKLAPFVSALFSPRGDFIYASTENGNLVVFETFKGSGQEEDSTLKVSEKEILGMCHHPFANILGIFDDEGDLRLWKA